MKPKNKIPSEEELFNIIDHTVNSFQGYNYLKCWKAIAKAIYKRLGGD